MEYASRPGVLSRFGLFTTILGVLTLVDLAGSIALLHRIPWGVDFLPTWTGAHAVWSGARAPYDFAFITSEQRWVLDWFRGASNGGPVAALRPFVSTPSALIIFAPLGLLGYWPAVALWNLVSAGANAAAAAHASGRIMVAALALALPVSALSFVTGQTTLIISAIVILALAWVHERPIASGLLFAAAAAIKPQCLMLLPIALLSTVGVRALAVAVNAWLLLAFAAALAFGARVWSAWYHALGEFAQAVFPDIAARQGMINPSGAALYWGLSSNTVAAVQILSVTFSLIAVWLTFKRPHTLAVRAVALLGGGILSSLFTQPADAALLAAPASMLLLQETSWRGLAVSLIGYGLIFASVLPGWGAIPIAVFVVSVVLRELLARRDDDATLPARPAGLRATT